MPGTMDSSQKQSSLRLFVKGSFACSADLMSASNINSCLKSIAMINLKWKMDMMEAERRYFSGITTLSQGRETFSNDWYYNVYELRISGCPNGFEKLKACVNSHVAVVKVCKEQLLFMTDSQITQRLGIKPIKGSDGRRLHCIHMSRDSSQQGEEPSPLHNKEEPLTSQYTSSADDPFVRNYTAWPPTSSLLTRTKLSELFLKQYKNSLQIDISSSCARTDCQFVERKLLQADKCETRKSSGKGGKSERSETEAEVHPERKRHKSEVAAEKESAKTFREPSKVRDKDENLQKTGKISISADLKTVHKARKSELLKTEQKKSKHSDKQRSTSKSSKSDKPTAGLSKQQHADEVFSSMFSGLTKGIGRIPKKNRPSSEDHVSSPQDTEKETKRANAWKPEGRKIQSHEDKKAENLKNKSVKSEKKDKSVKLGREEKQYSQKLKHTHDKEHTKKSKDRKEKSNGKSEIPDLHIGITSERGDDVELLDSVKGSIKEGSDVRKMIRDSTSGLNRADNDMAIPGLGDLAELNALLKQKPEIAHVKRSIRVTDDDLKISVTGSIYRRGPSECNLDLEDLVKLALFGNRVSIPMTEACSQLYECTLSVHRCQLSNWSRSVRKEVVKETNKFSYQVKLFNQGPLQSTGEQIYSISAIDMAKKGRKSEGDGCDDVTYKLMSIVNKEKCGSWTFPADKVLNKGAVKELVIPDLIPADLSSDDELSDISRIMEREKDQMPGHLERETFVGGNVRENYADTDRNITENKDVRTFKDGDVFKGKRNTPVPTSRASTPRERWASIEGKESERERESHISRRQSRTEEKKEDKDGRSLSKHWSRRSQSRDTCRRRSRSPSRQSNSTDRSRRSPSRNSRPKTPTSEDKESGKEYIGKRLEKIAASTALGEPDKIAPDKVAGRTEKRHERQYHPYKKDDRPSRRHIPHWSFDLAYSDMNQLLLNMTENSFKRLKKRPAEVHGRNNLGRRSYGNRGRFCYYRFKRAEVTRTPPREIYDSSEEEDYIVHPDELPDLKERAKQADVLEKFMGNGEDEREFSTELMIYEKEINEDKGNVMIGKDDKLCSVVVIPGGPKPAAFSGQELEDSNEESTDISFLGSSRAYEEQDTCKVTIEILQKESQDMLTTNLKDINYDERKSEDKNDRPIEENTDLLSQLNTSNSDENKDEIDKSNKTEQEKKKEHVSFEFGLDSGNDDETRRKAKGTEHRGILSSDSDVCLDWSDEDTALDKKEDVFKESGDGTSDNDSVLTVVDECVQTSEKSSSDGSVCEASVEEHNKTIDALNESDYSPIKSVRNNTLKNCSVALSPLKCERNCTSIQSNDGKREQNDTACIVEEKKQCNETETNENTVKYSDLNDVNNHNDTENLADKLQVSTETECGKSTMTVAESKMKLNVSVETIQTNIEDTTRTNKDLNVKQYSDKALEKTNTDALVVNKSEDYESELYTANADDAITAEKEHEKQVSSRLLEGKSDTENTVEIVTKIVAEINVASSVLKGTGQTENQQKAKVVTVNVDEDMTLRNQVEIVLDSCISAVELQEVNIDKNECSRNLNEVEFIDKAGDRLVQDKTYLNNSGSKQETSVGAAQTCMNVSILEGNRDAIAEVRCYLYPFGVQNSEASPTVSSEDTSTDAEIDPTYFGKNRYVYIDENLIIGKTEQEVAQFEKEMNAADYHKKEKFVELYESYRTYSEDENLSSSDDIPELEEYEERGQAQNSILLLTGKCMKDMFFESVAESKSSTLTFPFNCPESKRKSNVKEDMPFETYHISKTSDVDVSLHEKDIKIEYDWLNEKIPEKYEIIKQDDVLIAENNGEMMKIKESVLHERHVKRDFSEEKQFRTTGSLFNIAKTRECENIKETVPSSVNVTNNSDLVHSPLDVEGGTFDDDDVKSEQINKLALETSCNSKGLDTGSSFVTSSGIESPDIHIDEESTSSTWAYPLSEPGAECYQRSDGFISQLEDEAVFCVKDTIDEGTEEKGNCYVNKNLESETQIRCDSKTLANIKNKCEEQVEEKPQNPHQNIENFQYRTNQHMNDGPASQYPYAGLPMPYFERPWYPLSMYPYNTWPTGSAWQSAPAPHVLPYSSMYAPHESHMPVMHQEVNSQSSFSTFPWNQVPVYTPSPNYSAGAGLYSPTFMNYILNGRREAQESTPLQNRAQSAVTMAPWIISTDNMAPYMQHRNADTYFVTNHCIDIAGSTENDGNLDDGESFPMLDIPVHKIPLPEAAQKISVHETILPETAEKFSVHETISPETAQKISVHKIPLPETAQKISVHVISLPETAQKILVHETISPETSNYSNPCMSEDKYTNKTLNIQSITSPHYSKHETDTDVGKPAEQEATNVKKRTVRETDTDKVKEIESDKVSDVQASSVLDVNNSVSNSQSKMNSPEQLKVLCSLRLKQLNKLKLNDKDKECKKFVQNIDEIKQAQKDFEQNLLKLRKSYCIGDSQNFGEKTTEMWKEEGLPYSTENSLCTVKNVLSEMDVPIKDLNDCENHCTENCVHTPLLVIGARSNVEQDRGVEICETFLEMKTSITEVTVPKLSQLNKIQNPNSLKKLCLKLLESLQRTNRIHLNTLTNTYDSQDRDVQLVEGSEHVELTKAGSGNHSKQNFEANIKTISNIDDLPEKQITTISREVVNDKQNVSEQLLDFKQKYPTGDSVIRTEKKSAIKEIEGLSGKDLQGKSNKQQAGLQSDNIHAESNLDFANFSSGSNHLHVISLTQDRKKTSARECFEKLEKPTALHSIGHILNILRTKENSDKKSRNDIKNFSGRSEKRDSIIAEDQKSKGKKVKRSLGTEKKCEKLEDVEPSEVHNQCKEFEAQLKLFYSDIEDKKSLDIKQENALLQREAGLMKKSSKVVSSILQRSEDCQFEDFKIVKGRVAEYSDKGQDDFGHSKEQKKSPSQDSNNGKERASSEDRICLPTSSRRQMQHAEYEKINVIPNTTTNNTDDDSVSGLSTFKENRNQTGKGTEVEKPTHVKVHDTEVVQADIGEVSTETGCTIQMASKSDSERHDIKTLPTALSSTGDTMACENTELSCFASFLKEGNLCDQTVSEHVDSNRIKSSEKVKDFSRKDQKMGSQNDKLLHVSGLKSEHNEQELNLIAEKNEISNCQSVKVMNIEAIQERGNAALPSDDKRSLKMPTTAACNYSEMEQDALKSDDVSVYLKKRGIVTFSEKVASKFTEVKEASDRFDDFDSYSKTKCEKKDSKIQHFEPNENDVCLTVKVAKESKFRYSDCKGSDQNYTNIKHIPHQNSKDVCYDIQPSAKVVTESLFGQNSQDRCSTLKPNSFCNKHYKERNKLRFKANKQNYLRGLEAESMKRKMAYTNDWINQTRKQTQIEQGLPHSGQNKDKASIYKNSDLNSCEERHPGTVSKELWQLPCSESSESSGSKSTDDRSCNSIPKANRFKSRIYRKHKASSDSSSSSESCGRKGIEANRNSKRLPRAYRSISSSSRSICSSLAHSELNEGDTSLEMSRKRHMSGSKRNRSYSSSSDTSTTSVSSRERKSFSKYNRSTSYSSKSSSRGRYRSVESQSGRKRSDRFSSEKHGIRKFESRERLRSRKSGYRTDLSDDYHCYRESRFSKFQTVGRFRNIFLTAPSDISSSEFSTESQASTSSTSCSRTSGSPLRYENLTQAMENIIQQYAEGICPQSDLCKKAHVVLKMKKVLLKQDVLKKLQTAGLEKFLQALAAFSSERCSWMIALLASDVMALDSHMQEDIKMLEKQNKSLSVVTDINSLDSLLLSELRNPDVVEIFVIIDPPDEDEDIRSIIKYCCVKTFLDRYLTASIDSDFS